MSVIAGESAERPWWQASQSLARPERDRAPGSNNGMNTASLAPLFPAVTGTGPAVEVASPAAWADAWFRWEALAAPPPDLAEPFSLPWFLALEYQRHHRQARWLAEALEFRRHHGETVLAVGHGLGTDWVQYARHGARVIVCSRSAEELEVVRQQFHLRGLPGVFLHCPQLPLPLPSHLADLACVQSLLSDGQEFPVWLAEVRRVLKPGGKLLMLESAKHFAGWRGRCWMRQLRSLLLGFEAVKIRRHHLPRSQVPWLLRWLPRRWLERFFGRFLLIRAIQPVVNPLTQQRLAA